MTDDFIHIGMRMQLVDELRAKGIKDENVLGAIAEIPRHLFMDQVFLKFAYKDKAFPIGCEQTISQPYTVAFQTELLQLKPHEKVLEVGTGSGYQTAVLVALKTQVFTIERQKADLYVKLEFFTKNRLSGNVCLWRWLQRIAKNGSFR